jgi:hypothetical protein
MLKPKEFDNTLVSNQSKAIAANAAKDKAHGLFVAAKPS